MNYLSETEQAFLNKIFGYRTVTKWKRNGEEIKQGSKKSLVPIGVNELMIKELKWVKTKQAGKPMLHIKIWKAPDFVDVLGTMKQRHIKKNISFDLINCYHLISKERRFKLNERWFYPVGSFYTKEQLDSLFKLKGVKFMALVKHVEQEYREKPFLKAEIIKVFPRGEEVDCENINYVELYERLKK